MEAAPLIFGAITKDGLKRMKKNKPPIVLPLFMFLRGVLADMVSQTMTIFIEKCIKVHNIKLFSVNPP